MKKLIALLLIALVIVVSGCTAFTTQQPGGAGNQTANPLSEDFGSSGNADVGSPPSMPEMPG